MILQKRDNDILEFIDTFKVATASVIRDLYFNTQSQGLTLARNRLNIMHQNKLLKREREYVSQEYIYYKTKVKQIRHKFLLTKFYAAVNKCADVTYFKPEFEVGSLVADGFFATKLKDNKSKMYFVEIHISNNNPNLIFEKYETLFRSFVVQEKYGGFPSLLIVTDKGVKLPENSNFKSYVLNLNFDGLESVLNA